MKKAACIFMAAAMLIGMASCGRNGDDLSKAKKVPEGGTWWNDTVTEISGGDIWNEFDNRAYQVFNRYLYADDESVILSFSAFINNEDDGFNESECLLRNYSNDGKLLGQVNVGDSFAEGTNYSYTGDIYKKNGEYYTFADVYDEDKGTYVCYCYGIDFDGGILKDPFIIDIPSEDKRPSSLKYITDVGDKLVAAVDYQNSDFTFTSEILVIEGDEVKTFAPDFGYYSKVEYIDNLMQYDGLVSFVANITDNGIEKVMFCTLDPDTLDFDSVELDYYSALDYKYVPGCGIFDIGDNRSVKKIDPFTGDEEVILDLSDTFVNGLFTADPELVLVTDDKVVIHEKEEWKGSSLDTSKLILLEKTDADPNAGKALLSLAPLLEMTSQEYYAVNDFNRNSDKYFIEVDYKYYDALMKYEDLEEDSAYPDYGIINACAADAVDILMSDIREGTGPDLVIYDNSSAQLNNEDYLTDLTKRISAEKDLAGGDYMAYILEPNGWDGNHYRLDYGFCFDGMVIKDSLTESGAQGLTFEQYEKVINENNGGVINFAFDDISMMKALISSSDYFAYDKSGKFTINDGFKELADYITSVPDGSYDVDCRENDPLHENHCGNFNAYDDYCFTGGYAEFSVIGKPSPDGHPEAVSGRGTGITSCCVLKDAAWSFVMKMMSPDVQLMSGYYDHDPVLKSALRTIYEEQTEQHNALCGVYPKSYSSVPVPGYLLDRYMDQISDAVRVPDVDSSVLVIFYEEMPAYFEGQKSYEDVTSIIGNRVNLMLSERD